MLVEKILPVARERLVTIAANAPLADAAKLLGSTQINLVVVSDFDEVVVGVVTKSDVVRQIGQCRFARRDPVVAFDVFRSLLVQMGVLHCRGCACTTTVAKVMTKGVTSCRPSDLLQDVWLIMKWHGFLGIPVIDQEFRPLGVLNARDALQVLLEKAEDEELLLLEYIVGIGYR